MFIWIIITIILLSIIVSDKKKIAHIEQKETMQNDMPIPETQNDQTKYCNNYQRRWMFSYNEKEAYRKLKTISTQHNLELFAKVRLLDLLEPKKTTDRRAYRTALWKIQAKHVDFVFCDSKLVAKFVIELDDKTHNNQTRKERDTFVDDILQRAGYKVLRVRSIEEEVIKQFLNVSTPSTTV